MPDEILIIKPKKIRGEDGYRTFSIRIKESIVSRVDDIASQTGRSRNELIGTLLTYSLDHCVIGDDSVPRP